MTFQKFYILAFIATILFVTPQTWAKGEEEQQCIRLSYIHETKVVDNKTILVDMKGSGGHKRIDLRNRCIGLKMEGGFSYSTSINKLCKQDRLAVLRIGTPCMIDKIVDITENEAEALMDRKYNRTPATN